MLPSFKANRCFSPRTISAPGRALGVLVADVVCGSSLQQVDNAHVFRCLDQRSSLFPAKMARRGAVDSNDSHANMDSFGGCCISPFFNFRDAD